MNNLENVIIPDGNQNKEIRNLQQELCGNLSQVLNQLGIYVAPIFPLYARFKQNTDISSLCKEITEATITDIKNEQERIILLASIKTKSSEIKGFMEILRLVTENGTGLQEEQAERITGVLQNARDKLPIKLCVFKAAEVSFSQEENATVCKHSWAVLKEKWVKPRNKK